MVDETGYGIGGAVEEWAEGGVEVNDGFVFGKGGVPLLADGLLLGAVGVSGAVPAESDHVIANTAAGNPVVPKTH